ncbi:Myeloid-derived growth factor [Galemys pyrenaicus]|uniref:Myeloid-derived growth factor n=1 Tax=Galemys pyrenaicus TaxID=202257 RepID=A0A8J6DTA9_GALPY|nr:Myeloid-derived growth factor [Galemys pyrenaicus]
MQRQPSPAPKMAAPTGGGTGRSRSRGSSRRTWPSAAGPRVPRCAPSVDPALRFDSKMAAPSGRRRIGGGGSSFWVALLLAALALRLTEAVSEPMTVAFDVRPGGVVHSFSQNVGPEDKYTCTFTYASQGGTNERWQMSLGTSEDHQHFTCTIWRPQGKSYLYFTQFKAEVQGAEIEYGMAYSKAAFERESDVPLKSEEFEVTRTAGGTGHQLPASLPSLTYNSGPGGFLYGADGDVRGMLKVQPCVSFAVAHRPGAFKAELSKLVIVAKAAHSEL